MDGLQKALSSLRAYYKSNGGPSHANIADAAGLSESTVQRYLGGAQIKQPSYDSILAIASAIGMGTADLTLNRELVDEIENKEQLRDMIMELRQLNIEELARNDDHWRERMDQERANHNEQLAHLQQVYAEQLGQITKVSNDQSAQMLANHQEQERHIQETARVQYEALQAFAKEQKAADENAKAYLKRQIRTWKIISFLLVFAFILLLIVDLTNPTRGWLRMISGLKLFSWHGVA